MGAMGGISLAFIQIEPKEIADNPFKLIGSDWMLITAGDEKKCNTMTASWGGVGVLWNKPVSFIFVRPQRYTREFIEREQAYSLCFFEDGFRPQLSYLGTASGRDEDKIGKAGLTTTFEGGVPYFEQARLVLICKKSYRDDLKADCFLDAEADARCYPEKDYHRMYVGEIVKVLKKK